MENLLGSSWSVFFGITVVLFGGASFLMGQALAETWRPAWQNVAYAIPLGLADRFIHFALFQQPLLTLTGYLIDTAVLIAFALLAYSLTRARKMVTQYSWLYERDGLFGWRERVEAVPNGGNPPGLG